MDDRTQMALDGELAREQLTPAEAAAVDAAEAEIRAITRTIRFDPLPDLAPAVMRRIAHSERRRMPAIADVVKAMIDRVWKPRPMSIGWRPAYGAAAALVLALAVAIGRWTAPETDATQLVFTQFVLDAPSAQQVSLAGDFTNWQPSYQLTRSGQHAWTVVVPLEPGIHNYAFVIDGERWVPDPNAPAFDDGFGGLNSRLAVIAPDRAEL